MAPSSSKHAQADGSSPPDPVQDVPEDFIRKMNAILVQKKPVKTVWNEAVALLEEYKLIWTIHSVHCKYMFVHTQNRGGLGLIAVNCHNVGEKIFRVGADKKELANAFAFEIALSGKQRESIISFNQRLINLANGLLPSASGFERYSSIGCGHTAAFIKHAGQGGKTPSKILQEENGRINLAALSKQEHMKDMLDNGWDWRIISAAVDAAVPKLAKIGQKALNASNNVASLMSEFETAVYLADAMEDSSDAAKDVVIQSVEDLSAPCASYAATIYEYVKNYSGGPDAPLVRLLDNMAKEFKCHVTLGETYWKAVTDATFSDKTHKRPLVRACMLLANLTTDKVEDGFGRLLTKSHMAKVTSKDSAGKVAECEDILSKALEIRNACLKVNVERHDVSLKAIGQLFV